jgi:hypothetical protein
MPIAACLALAAASAGPQEEWLQSRFDSQRSGHAPGRRVDAPPGLLAAVPFGDAVFTTPDPDAIRLVATGPRLDPSECNAAVVSNGRIFTTGQGSGVQAGQPFGREAAERRSPWERLR